MDWLEMKLFFEKEDLDRAIGAFYDAGLEEFAVEDPEELEDFLEHSPYYDYVEDEVLKMRQKKPAVTFYLPQDGETQVRLKEIENALESAGVTYTKQQTGLKEEDWANNWKQYFKPLRVGEKLYIKPSWETLEDDEGRMVLEIDPSSSFGTGGHATTQLTLELLEKELHPGAKVLDMGCGSGILGVAAMLLGAGQVTGVDIEEDAMLTSRENARRNGVAQEKFSLYCGNVLEDAALLENISREPYDVVLANIVANVVIAMAPLFYRLLKEDGVLLASGIIEEREQEVMDALSRAGFCDLELVEREDWAAVRGRKGK